MSGSIRRPVFGVGRADPDTRARGAALRTPSPTFSDVSIASSHGPRTPPLMPRALPFTGTTPNVPTTRVNDTLTFRLDKRVSIAYDVNDHPSRASLAPGVRRSLQMMLGEPATQPPMSQLVLVSDLLPWHTYVNLGAAAGAAAPNAPRIRPISLPDEDGTPAPREPCIAIEDVLAALHQNVRTPLEPNELRGFTTERRAGVQSAFRARVDKIEDARTRERESASGPRRVDLIGAAGRTHFLGLSPTKRGPNVFVAHFG